MSYKCRTDPEYALTVYSKIKTDRGRELFLRVYGVGALRARGSTIAAVRAKQRGGTWEWEAQMAVPPPGDSDRGGTDA
jgi:hypothetical protein